MKEQGSIGAQLGQVTGCLGTASASHHARLGQHCPAPPLAPAAWRQSRLCCQGCRRVRPVRRRRPCSHAAAGGVRRCRALGRDGRKPKLHIYFASERAVGTVVPQRLVAPYAGVVKCRALLVLLHILQANRLAGGSCLCGLGASTTGSAPGCATTSRVASRWVQQRLPHFKTCQTATRTDC